MENLETKIDPDAAALAETANKFVTQVLNTISVENETHQLWFKSWIGCMLKIQQDMERRYNEHVAKRLIASNDETEASDE